MAEKKAPAKTTTTVQRAKRTPNPALENETPEQRFVRLGEFRTKGAIKRIMMLGSLSGPNYKSTEEQRKRIIQLLRHAVDTVESRLEKTKAASIEVKL